jgi:hypothetical protein
MPNINLEIMSQKECKACKRELWENPPFCPNCWEKNFTDEEFQKSDRVWVIRTKLDLHTCAEKAKDASPHTYILIEGELIQQISKAFDFRAKLASKQNRKKLQVAGTAATILATGAIHVLTQQSGSKVNPSELLKKTVPSVAGGVVAGIGLEHGSNDDEEEFKTLAFASECSSMFNANFRVLRNAHDYVILRRETTMIEDADIGIKGTANDFKSVAEDVGNVVKKGWKWIKLI